MDKSNEKPVLSIRIDADLLKRIDAICEATSVGRGEIVERCILMGLTDEEEFVDWIKSPIKGPILELLARKSVIAKLLGFEFSKTQAKVVHNVRAKRKPPVKASPREA
jgi:hypothetical protein